jgi:polyferredoxin
MPKSMTVEVGMKSRQKIRMGLLVAACAFFPVTLYYFSPLLSLQGIASGVVSGSIMVFGLQFLASLVLGRAFCGWVCPAGGAQELVALVKGRKVNRKKIGRIKWATWTPWAVALVFFALRAGGVRTVDFTYQTWHGISVTDLPGLIAFASVVALFVILAVAIGRRAGCHTVCWMAPFMVIGRKIRNIFDWPALRLAVKKEQCRECGSCSRHCPMSIEVGELVREKNMETDDCILCGSCVDACPKNVIHYSFSSGH